MDFKLLGSILLIIGTSLGAGMLGLPIAAAQLGFAGSVILLIVCWFIMTTSAFLLLEVNLWCPQGHNLVSMAKLTIGPWGQLLAWVTYLLLPYSLMCAYIAGGSDLFHNLLYLSGIESTRWVSSLGFTALFGSIVYLGIRSVDYVNRGLMTVKLAAYILMVILLLPIVSPNNLLNGDIAYLTSTTAIMVTITSYGFATIIPTLRIYFAGDIHKLRIAIIVGSIIPLICYIFWDMVIMGVIPLEGANGLISVSQAVNSTSHLVNTLDNAASHGIATFCIKLFTSICVITSFLGVALGLTDFLADGLSLEKKGIGNVIVHGISFLPPLTIVLFYPDIFIKALKYAGIYCIVLLVLLPTWMTWSGRYTRKISKGYQVLGGKMLLVLLLVLAGSLIALGLIV